MAPDLKDFLEQKFEIINTALSSLQLEIKNVDDRLKAITSDSIRQQKDIEHIQIDVEKQQQENSRQIDLIWRKIQEEKQNCKNSCDSRKNECEKSIDVSINNKVLSAKLWAVLAVLGAMAALFISFTNKKFL